MSSSKYDSGEYDHFAGGLTQPEPNLNVPKPPKRARYSDDWANSPQGFAVKGPDIDKSPACVSGRESGCRRRGRRRDRRRFPI